jgi:hypothetical protein
MNATGLAPARVRVANAARGRTCSPKRCAEGGNSRISVVTSPRKDGKETTLRPGERAARASRHYGGLDVFLRRFQTRWFVLNAALVDRRASRRLDDHEHLRSRAAGSWRFWLNGADCFTDGCVAGNGTDGESVTADGTAVGGAGGDAGDFLFNGSGGLAGNERRVVVATRRPGPGAAFGSSFLLCRGPRPNPATTMSLPILVFEDRVRGVAPPVCIS